MAYMLIFPVFYDPSGLRNNSFPISLNGKAHDTAVVLAWLQDEMAAPSCLSVPGIG